MIVLLRALATKHARATVAAWSTGPGGAAERHAGADGGDAVAIVRARPNMASSSAVLSVRVW
jgi:hypothetical protein